MKQHAPKSNVCKVCKKVIKKEPSVYFIEDKHVCEKCYLAKSEATWPPRAKPADSTRTLVPQDK
jgi:hypothetical protein